MSTVTDAKKALRHVTRGVRDALESSWQQLASGKICRKLEAEVPENILWILSYFPFGSEVNVRAFNSAMSERGVNLLLPKVNKATGKLDLYKVTSLEKDLKLGVWGIQEPDPNRCEMVDVSVVEWVTVPGLAFNRQGDRLGYGGGYYDKLLAIMPKAIRVGVAFSTQISSDIPLEHHDLRVDMLITEKETIAFDRVSH